MQRMRAVLVRNDNGQPLEPAWNPLIGYPEINEANQRLTNNGAIFHWRWLHSLPAASST
jgi:hypothetical protein